jgi:hypothetical protein
MLCIRDINVHSTRTQARLMPFLPQPRQGELGGDFARRRAYFIFITFLILLPISIWLFVWLERLWFLIMPLEGAIFVLASAMLGGALAIAPLAALVALLVSVWYGVESVHLARTHPTPWLDRLIIGTGLVVSFSPAIALAAMASRAILAGSIAFSRPQREYLLATDPIAFWQSIGFLLIVAAALAYPAWHYWRAKLGHRAGHAGR